MFWNNKSRSGHYESIIPTYRCRIAMEFSACPLCNLTNFSRTFLELKFKVAVNVPSLYFCYTYDNVFRDEDKFC